MNIRLPGKIAGRIRVARLAAVLIGSLALTACPSTSEDPPPPACQTNNTANVSFRNITGSSMTYQVNWDGAIIGALTPGQTGLSRTVSAGVPHTLVFRNATNTANACTPSTPNLAQCTSTIFSCSA